MEIKESKKGEQMTKPKATMLTGEPLRQAVLTNIRKFCDESSKRLKEDLLKHISSKEKVAG